MVSICLMRELANRVIARHPITEPCYVDSITSHCDPTPNQLAISAATYYRPKVVNGRRIKGGRARRAANEAVAGRSVPPLPFTNEP